MVQWKVPGIYEGDPNDHLVMEFVPHYSVCSWGYYIAYVIIGQRKNWVIFINSRIEILVQE